MYLVVTVLLIFGNCAVVVNCAREPPIVTIPDQGMLMGTYLKMFRTQVVVGYLGLPYAQAPLNERRFLPPVVDNLPKWDNVRNASKLPAECLQNLNKPMRKHEEAFMSLISKSYGLTTFSANAAGGESGGEEAPPTRQFDEDCLFLNIYIPDGTRWHWIKLQVDWGQYNFTELSPKFVLCCSYVWVWFFSRFRISMFAVLLCVAELWAVVSH